MKLISWNVNGIRAVFKKGFDSFMQACDCDVLCLQETKASPEQFPEELKKGPFSQIHSASAKRKGYSGVATFLKPDFSDAPTTAGLGIDKYDTEGRVLRTDFEKFVLYNVYFPNGTSGAERLEYKMEFYADFLKILKKDIASAREIAICGDFNIAHRSIDLARPKNNEKNSGFLLIERQMLDTYLSAGFVDSFRHLKGPIEGAYSWWDYRFHARDNNVGWRIDYFYITEGLKPFLKDAFILNDVYGSDHCPVGIVLEF
ncbi:exodeoxyribonuclease III [Myxococcota bacterium]|nr:exodeoxyribonuclease III [Myxococcota bacterium]MBU1379180.1 exodeoxyribonuclease III [Myxococcota bacterium]MBU1497500.1 exodeoxyribonuclease III [Myxococcota bacterium]